MAINDQTTSKADDDEMRALGVKVQQAINYSASSRTALQIDIDDPEHGRVYLRVHAWARR